jgi:hypothetical protein
MGSPFCVFITHLLRDMGFQAFHSERRTLQDYAKGFSAHGSFMPRPWAVVNAIIRHWDNRERPCVIMEGMTTDLNGENPERVLFVYYQ